MRDCTLSKSWKVTLEWPTLIQNYEATAPYPIGIQQAIHAVLNETLGTGLPFRLGTPKVTAVPSDGWHRCSIGGIMAKTYHEKIVSKALEYIRRAHSDQSVSLEQTLASLETLREEIEDCIAGVNEDIERARPDETDH